LTFSERFQEIRTGFERPFWVANTAELFERLSYYGTFASLALYLKERLNFSSEQTGALTGIFGGVVWFLAAFGGALADRMGFRRSLSLAYLVLSCAYFLLGAIGAPWFSPVRNVVPLAPLVAIILALPALGISLIKPCDAGTTARASRENVRSIGYSIYYTLINIGGACGPLMASWVHEHLGVENVFRVSALSVFAMFFAIRLFYTEPRRTGDVKVASLAQTARNFLTVVSNPRFVLFLVIFAGYYIVFWQQFFILPIYIHHYVSSTANTERLLVTDALTVVCLQMAVAYATRKIPSLRAIALGTLISSLAWLVLVARPSVPMAVLTLVLVAVGEITQQPRYYEYISRLAPPGQQGTYMGFAFMPIGIGSLVGGPLGGFLVRHFGEVQHRPAMIWWSVTGVGIVTATAMWLYDRFVRNVSVSAN
jgi:dipeptide/tripeptide permease